ncbi:hypothetical protein KL933_001177 [Ogataea haglerorum]|uniref:NEDD8-activating enzyme E1 regulatory subunit n=1 Tax=Ogataea haglerorum TaxID=1937702 RepID=A0AAN6DA31_9ASCO|nr:hypothetical protein KL933_001177 [Ogataea haglerorum]KAG7740329.1 hypothetical protein KL923_002170 [Ogataea haglerorum]
MNDSDVNSKYDRQMRLWSSSGQTRLVGSRVCVVEANAVACETVKNLVLAGVGQVVLLDSERVSGEDLATNFFVVPEDTGKPRGERAATHLGELNPDSTVLHDKAPFESLLEDRSFWSQFDCVVNCRLDPCVPLIDLLWALGVPLLHAHSIGLYSLVRLYCEERTMVETHSPRADDLRIDAVWPELQEYVDAVDGPSLAEVPYSVLLIKVYQGFMREHGSRPGTKEARRRLAQLGNGDNVEEAIRKAALVTKRSSELSDKLAQLMQEKVDLATASPFWVLVEALRQFYEKHGVLPLSGSLPDMASNTEEYLKLQSIYRAKHEADKEELKGLALQVLAQHKRAEQIAESEIELFVKNCSVLEVHRGSKNVWSSEMLSESNPVLHNTNIYFGFLALNTFHKEHRRHAAPRDQSEVRALAISELCRWETLKSFPEGLELVLDELLRAEGTALHNVCALTGGIASQEVIKILTNQYVSFDNCLTFDGVRGQTGSWKIE